MKKIRKLNLFPKTFLYTIFMMVLLNLFIHAMIYFFYPKVYLNRIEENLEHHMDELENSIKKNSEDESGKILFEFAKENQVNVTVETKNGEKTYQGMTFQLSVAIDSDAVLSMNNFDAAQSIIIRKRTLKLADGEKLKIEVMASAKPLKEATDMIAFLLPFTFGITIIFSVVFAYFYSKKITNPIVNMLKVTINMKERKPDAVFKVHTGDELEMLARHMNEVYECLLSTIQELDEEKERMIEIEKSKNVFLRSASHELKTPLAGLRILLENMQYKVGKYKDRDTYLTKAVEKVDELTEMVKQILETSKNQEKLQNRSFQVKNELEQILEKYQMQIADKNLTVDLQIPKESVVCMKEDSFGQVWSNLISNAVRYTPAGGKIIIGANKNQIWIENTCKPLSKEELKYIFEPFYRTKGTRNKQEGSGLGLYVITEILKKENLKYKFEPFENGMKFWIELEKWK